MYCGTHQKKTHVQANGQLGPQTRITHKLTHIHNIYSDRETDTACNSVSLS